MWMELIPLKVGKNQRKKEKESTLGKKEDEMLVWWNRSICLSNALIGKLTLLRVLRAPCAARRAGSALAKSSSQSLCFPLTTTAMAATLRSSSSATTFSLDTFSVSIPTTWQQRKTFIQLYFPVHDSGFRKEKKKNLYFKQFGKMAKLKLVHSRLAVPFIFGTVHKIDIWAN